MVYPTSLTAILFFLPTKTLILFSFHSKNILIKTKSILSQRYTSVSGPFSSIEKCMELFTVQNWRYVANLRSIATVELKILERLGNLHTLMALTKQVSTNSEPYRLKYLAVVDCKEIGDTKEINCDWVDSFILNSLPSTNRISIQFLRKLVINCKNESKLPFTLVNKQSLKYVSLSGCSPKFIAELSKFTGIETILFEGIKLEYPVIIASGVTCLSVSQMEFKFISESLRVLDLNAVRINDSLKELISCQKRLIELSLNDIVLQSNLSVLPASLKSLSCNILDGELVSKLQRIKLKKLQITEEANELLSDNEELPWNNLTTVDMADEILLALYEGNEHKLDTIKHRGKTRGKLLQKMTNLKSCTINNFEAFLGSLVNRRGRKVSEIYVFGKFDYTVRMQRVFRNLSELKKINY